MIIFLTLRVMVNLLWWMRCIPMLIWLNYLANKKLMIIMTRGGYCMAHWCCLLLWLQLSKVIWCREANRTSSTAATVDLRILTLGTTIFPWNITGERCAQKAGSSLHSRCICRLVQLVNLYHSPAMLVAQRETHLVLVMTWTEVVTDNCGDIVIIVCNCLGWLNYWGQVITIACFVLVVNSFSVLNLR